MCVHLLVGDQLRDGEILASRSQLQQARAPECVLLLLALLDDCYKLLRWWRCRFIVSRNSVCHVSAAAIDQN